MHSKRQNEIIRYLSETRFARIEQLAELYHVSMETIRRDLLELEKDSAVKRVRGGVVYNSLRARRWSMKNGWRTTSLRSTPLPSWRPGI